MNATGPFATVVIPTHNRAASLMLTLGALAAQDCDQDAFDVVVVPNGCTDDTVERLRAIQAPFRLRVVSIDTPSASLARNTGAAHARAPLVIFLDDDIAPAPSFVSAHLAAHDFEPGRRAAPSPDRVVMGYVSMRLQAAHDRLAIITRARSEAMFDRMREAGHRFGYTDLLGANCSMTRTRFQEVGGFDLSLRCHEDRELGFRLIAAGAQFVFAEDARGTHVNAPSLARACERKRQEGRADVHLAQRFASLRPVLPLERPRTMRRRLCRGLAFRLPALGDLSTRGLLATLPLLDRVGATTTWLRTLDAVLAYWYDRGLADAAGTGEALAALLRDAAEAAPMEGPALDVDLAGGLKWALHEVDRLRPPSATLRVGSHRIGHIPSMPGAERLSGRHVAAALVSSFPVVAFQALRAAGHVQLTAPSSAVRPPSPSPDGHRGGRASGGAGTASLPIVRLCRSTSPTYR